MIRWKAYKELIYLNAALVIIYFLVFSNLKIFIGEEIMFFTPDSQEYLKVSDEYFNGAEPLYSLTRPFLYPLFILVFYKTFGVFVFWLMQFLLWLVSINLVYLSIQKVCSNKIYAISGSLIMALNFTYIVSTLYGLTEVVSIFLLTVLLYYLVKNIEKRRTAIFFLNILLLLVLMTVVKPLFYIPVLTFLLIIFPIFYFKKIIFQPKNLIKLLLVLSPLLYQMSYMKIHHGSFTVSKISELTFKRYFVAQGIMANTKMEWADAVRKGESLTTSESLDYILKNKLVYLNVYFKNLKDNIKAYPVAFVYPEEYAHQPFFNYTYLMNDFYYYIHILFLIPSILMYVHFFRRKDWIRFVILTFVLFLSSYIILTSGISAMQGDRLVLPSLPIWVFAYIFILSEIVIYFSQRKKRNLKM